MKILELCEFSSGICGVWARVFAEAKLLAKKGYDVRVFSSNLIKGTNEIAKPHEEIEGVKIYRFPVKLKIGENALFWNFETQARKFNPDIIITHVYRHPHTNQALNLSKQLKAKCFLITHAPFVELKTRGLKLSIFAWVYDLIFRKNLNKFSKIIAITRWEIPYLLELGAEKDKIIYIPNGIQDEFFKKKITGFKAKKIIFLGRISPVKDIETLIKAFKIVNKKIKNTKLEIIGPVEQNYKHIRKFEDEHIKFLPAIYDLNRKIKKMQEADIFILPSKREAMPQALIEAMSLGKIVISSKTQGGKEIIQDKKTGFLFEIGNSKELAGKILFCLDKNKIKQIQEIKKQARKKAEEFAWNKLIKRLISLF